MLLIKTYRGFVFNRYAQSVRRRLLFAPMSSIFSPALVEERPKCNATADVSACDTERRREFEVSA